jgi:hypothetical protein
MKSIALPLARFALKMSLNFSLVGFLTSHMIADTTTTAQIANISTRVLCEKRDAVVVTEFAVQGTGTKYVILRGLGPSLRAFGVPNVLRNPTLTLLDDQGNILDYNDDWVDSPDKAAIIATGLAPTDDRESAIVYTLSPGIIYTSVESGAHKGTGVAISEVYDLQTSDQSTLISAIGTRGEISTGDNVLISGTLLIGTTPVGILIRALGPSLTAAGISHALANPTLELHDANGALIASNDNWRDTQEAEIIATGLPPANDLESALIATLPTGAYTAVVSGINSTVGIGFVQFYSLANPVPGPELNPAPIIPRK